jgi:hypothetical protein
MMMSQGPPLTLTQESFGSFNPSSSAQRKGSITSDGSTYNLFQSTRVNQVFCPLL